MSTLAWIPRADEHHAVGDDRSARSSRATARWRRPFGCTRFVRRTRLPQLLGKRRAPRRSQRHIAIVPKANRKRRPPAPELENQRTAHRRSQHTRPSYTHVEVKVGDPSLDKTFETAVAIQQRFQGQRRRGDFILLLPEQGDDWDRKCLLTPDLGKRISALTWIDAARAFRFALREGGESPAWRVWAHAYCGAIEQQLLRIPGCEEPVEWAQRLRFSRLAVARELLRTGEADDAR